ncbi:YceD family protein [Occultella kanbiaonis]|uniref:YceD family protein n=1 Tax=Occultella kanbiaonis TaxID=2675754 RepID=UPI0012BA0F4F|nr:YceD family protein [Occultella kanbiaonis]
MSHTPQGPFVISTHDLGRRPGSMRELTLTVPAAQLMGTEVIGVQAGNPIELDLRLEAVMEGVLVTGTAETEATGECVRCLRDIIHDVEVDLTELFAYAGGRHPKVEEEDEEAEPLKEMNGELLDLEETVTDAVVLSLPFQPLCRPDCPGLCPECGIRLEDAEPGHSHEILDPRWAALSGLTTADDSAEPAASDRRKPGPGPQARG